MTIHAIITGILEREGSTYTNDPKDSGGPTKYGITQAALSQSRGYNVTPDDVRYLTEVEARNIYTRRYIDRPGFRAILTLSTAIAEEVIDAGVNVGPAVATIWLQRALNGLNRNARDYQDIEVDGACGARTIAALKAYLTFRQKNGEIVLLRALNGLQTEFYISLAERRTKDEEFLFGWLLNRVQ